MGSNTITRYTKRSHDKWREKIKIGSIVNRLNAQALGEVEMSNNSLKAALKLVDKFLPNLSQVSSDVFHEHKGGVYFEIKPVRALEQHSPQVIEGEYRESSDDQELIKSERDGDR